jgi:hypothetical protein
MDGGEVDSQYRVTVEKIRKRRTSTTVMWNHEYVTVKS